MRGGSIAGPARAWMRLFRVPNLFTVPGDPLGGFLLCHLCGAPAAWWPVVPAMAASTLLYMAGLVFNDLADLEVDRRERPGRPLPGGLITRRAAWGAAVILTCTGLGLAALAGPSALRVALLLLLLILAYNFAFKDLPGLGAVCMGSCRGLSLLLGAASAGWRWPGGAPVAVAAGGLTLYVAAITVIARRETTPLAGKGPAFLPLAALLLCFGGLMLVARPSPVFMILALGALAWAGSWAVRLCREASPAGVQAAVGGLIRGLLLVQAAFVSLAGVPGLIAAAVLLGLWPVNRWLCRTFYAT